MASSSQPISKWLWFFGFALPIALGSFLSYLADLSPKYNATVAKSATQNPQAEFSFYRNLPQKKTQLVEVPVANIQTSTTSRSATASTTDQSKPASAAPPSQSTAFSEQVKQQMGGRVLQVGSYKRVEDAEKKRAELALLGLEASIKKANVGNNQTWYRVNLGPFDNNNDIENVQQTLTLYDIPSLVRSPN